MHGLDKRTELSTCSSLCALHFESSAFQKIGVPSILLKDALPTVSALVKQVKTGQIETLFIADGIKQNMKIRDDGDIDPKLAVDLDAAINYYISKNKKWETKEINGVTYLYKLIEEPLRVIACVKFFDSKIEMTYDGVTISKEFIENMLGKLFPLTIEKLPALMEYFDILNENEFRQQRPDINFNFEHNVENNQPPSLNSCRICFHPVATKFINDNVRVAFQDITNQFLVEDEKLSNKICSTCALMLSNTARNREVLMQNQKMSEKFASFVEEYQKKKEEEQRAKQEQIESIEALEDEYIMDDHDYDSIMDVSALLKGDEEESVEKEMPKKKLVRKDWFAMEGYR